MVRRPEQPPDEVIAEITRQIAERCHPRRVILIGSRARGDARHDSDYDVVVEFDVEPEHAAQLERAVYHAFARRDWSLNVIMRGAGQIERSANDPGTIDWDIVRQGRVLYSASGDYALTVVPREVREQPPESVRKWLNRARTDLQAAHYLAGHGQLWDHAAFHAQQSGEKYLKALLVSRFIRPERTHDLNDLLESVHRAGIALTGVASDCTLLTPFGVGARYGPRPASEAEARGALAAADRASLAIEALLP